MNRKLACSTNCLLFAWVWMLQGVWMLFRVWMLQRDLQRAGILQQARTLQMAEDLTGVWNLQRVLKMHWAKLGTPASIIIIFIIFTCHLFTNVV